MPLDLSSSIASLNSALVGSGINFSDVLLAIVGKKIVHNTQINIMRDNDEVLFLNNTERLIVKLTNMK